MHFPAPPPEVTYGFHVEDWIYWRTNTKAYPPITQSPIAKHIGSVVSNVFKCPFDRDNSERRFQNDANGPYIYSYSLTSMDISGAITAEWRLFLIAEKPTSSNWAASEIRPGKLCWPKSKPPTKPPKVLMSAGPAASSTMDVSCPRAISSPLAIINVETLLSAMAMPKTFDRNWEDCRNTTIHSIEFNEAGRR